MPPCARWPCRRTSARRPATPICISRLANQLFDENRLHEALRSFDRATQTDDIGLATLARKGKIRTALKVAEFGLARQEAEKLTGSQVPDADALSLLGDALWSNGLFDEADRAYERALVLSPEFPRARFGKAKSLATRSRLQEALDEALAASAAAPRDGEIHAAIGDIYERLNRYDEAVVAYNNYINLLPNKDRSDKAAWARAQVDFLDAFKGSDARRDRRGRPAQPAHAAVQAGEGQDRRAGPGQRRPHAGLRARHRLRGDGAVARDRTARARPADYLHAQRRRRGSGPPGPAAGARAVARVRHAQVRNLPVLIKNPALRGIPKREGESFSPLSLGMSMMIDYQKQLLTIGRNLPPTAAVTTKLPMRVSRLAMVRGVLNSNYPAYFVVDTGGEVISISSDTASALPSSAFRRIPLKVWGTSGWDRDAFLLPGNDLDFDRIEYRNFPLVVLNLRAPSVLLGFQLGGIVGHKFLSNYRVSMDLAQSELRLEKF